MIHFFYNKKSANPLHLFIELYNQNKNIDDNLIFDTKSV